MRHLFAFLLFSMLGFQFQLRAQVELYSEITGVVGEGVVHRVYALIPTGGSVQSIYAENQAPFTMDAPAGVFQSDAGALLSTGGTASNADSWWTIGMPSGISDVQETGGDDWNAAISAFASGTGFECSDEFGGAFFLLPWSTQGQSQDGKVLLGQFVSMGPIAISLNLQWKPSSSASSIYSNGMTLTMEPEGVGCTDPGALNFDGDALFDDGTCDWPLGAFDGLEFEVHRAAQGLMPPTYRIYAKVSNPNEGISRSYGTSSDGYLLQSTTGFHQETGGSAQYPGAASDTLLANRDSWVAIGQLSPLLFPGMSTSEFESGGVLSSDAQFGGGIVVMPGTGLGVPDADGRVLLAQVTTFGMVEYRTNLTLVKGDGETEEFIAQSLEIPGTLSGCADPTACNYTSGASLDDGSCLYTDALGDCGGDCLADADMDGICDDLEVEGCTNPMACNHDASATEDDGSCVFYDAVGVCGGDCGADLDQDGICDVDEIAGCTDSQAVNFNPAATDDDGTCIPNVDVDPDSSGLIGLIQEEVASMEGGALVYRIYAQFESEGFELVSIFGTEESPLHLEASEEFHQSPESGPLATDLPLVPTTTSEYDSWLTIGGDAPGTVSLLSVGIDYSEWENGGDLLVNSSAGGALFVIPGTQPAALSGEDGRVLIAQLASTSTMNVQLNLKFITPEGISPEVLGLQLEIPPASPGCMDLDACNWDVAANMDDGSCVYPAPFLDCNGDCVSDEDGDGVCDGLEYEGCTAVEACNYDSLVDLENSNPDSCQFPIDVYGTPHVDCDGICNLDSDGDGVCDADEQEGCTYSPACNYDPQASQEDGSCSFPEPGRDCEGNCLFDFNGDGTCDEPGQGGCTYPEAYNFDESAQWDDGSCNFPSGDCRFDGNGDGAVNISDLLDMLVALGTYCPD